MELCYKSNINLYLHTLNAILFLSLNKPTLLCVSKNALMHLI